MANPHSPFFPIIYVRGYAMTQSEIEDTTADPFCGFNLGSTVYRAVADRKLPPKKFVFESPLLRLASDYGYRDVYEDGYDILDDDWERDGRHHLSARSIIIHRYYDEASELLGIGKRPSIDAFAKALSRLIHRVRKLVCDNPENALTPRDFRCYLVAHSMGGLVCRAFLQVPENDPAGVIECVDKFFTYATPHNGIDFSPLSASGAGSLNVPAAMQWCDLDNFSRPRIAEYLGLQDLYEATGRVDCIRNFPGERVFCLIGTNRLDYETAMGMSKTFVGHGSDGLVRIENAGLFVPSTNGKPAESCAKGYVYRSHSGFFGIVNSEEGYQNLTRFLFGDVRVDIWIDISHIELPAQVAAAQAAGKEVNALYQIEMTAAPRAKPWFLSRRKSEEDSVACVTHKEWQQDPATHGTRHLATVFLSRKARINPDRDSLAYAMALGVRVPDYEVERRILWDVHYEGGFLFQDSMILELVPPGSEDGEWIVSYTWQTGRVRPPDIRLDPRRLAAGKVEMEIALPDNISPGMPGIRGNIRLVASAWNTGRQLEE